MLADDAVGLDELVNITDGSILIGGASDAPTEVAVTGDVTITNAGVTAIGAQKVVNSMLADATIDLTSKVTGVLPITNGGTGANSAASARASLGFISGTLIWSNKDSGSGATATFTVSGISASSIVTGAIKSGGSNTSIYTIEPNTDEITFILSGTPSNSAVLMYISIN